MDGSSAKCMADRLGAATPGISSTTTRWGNRFITRSGARRISVIRDALAAIKDAGLIAAVVALLFFHDTVAGYFVNLTALHSGQVIEPCKR